MIDLKERDAKGAEREPVAIPYGVKGRSIEEMMLFQLDLG
jgi:hypothetical protein